MLTEAVGAVHRAKIDENTAATNEIIAADTHGRAIRILGLYLRNNAAADVAVTIQDDADTPNVLSGPHTIAAAGELTLNPTGLGWMEGAAGKAIDMVQDGTERVTGNVIYQFVGAP